MKDFIWLIVGGFFFVVCVVQVADLLGVIDVKADQPHMNCECRELTRIRLLLEHQFGVICDERHCEGQSSSGGGSSLP